MAFVYEVNGQRVEFEKEPTEKDIDEAARSLGAARPESQRKVTETGGGAAIILPNITGRRPESQQNREASADMALQTARGVASTIPSLAGIPGSVVNSVANAPRTAQDISNRYQIAREAFTGQAPQTQPLPEQKQVTPYDMSYFANLTPGPQPSSPAGQLAFGAGQMAGAPIVPPAMKMAAPVAKYGYELGKDVVSAGLHPIQTGKTAVEAFGRGYAGKVTPGSEGSALMPIRETYVEHGPAKQFMEGKIPATSLTEVPTAPLTQNNLFSRFAYNMAPTNAEGQALVAPRGRTLEGYMENLGATYKEKPLMGALDIATTLGGIGPVSAMAKTIPALSARQLTNATNFESGFGPARAAALQREGQMGLQAGMPPTQNLLPAPGPVQPMIAGPQGITGPGGTPLPTQASGQPVTQPATNPKQYSQQVAATKIQPVNPAQQADWAQRSGGGYTPPMQQVTTPVQRPQPQPRPQPAPVVETPGVRNSATIRKELDMISRQSDDLHESGLQSGIKYGTPEGESYQAQLGQLNARTKVLQKELEEALKTEKKSAKAASKKGPNNVSQMLIEDTSKSKVYPSKEAFEKESIFSTLKDEPHTGSYIQGDKIIHVEKLDYGTLPKDITKDFQQTKMYATDKNGNRVPIGKTWTDIDPEPLGARVRSIIDRNKGKKK
jgi:hypothetical protein